MRPRGRQHCARVGEPAGLWEAGGHEATLCSWGRSADVLGLSRGPPPSPSPLPTANLCNHFTTSCRVSWAWGQWGSAQLVGLGRQPSWREPRARVFSGKEESLLAWLSSWTWPMGASPLLTSAPAPPPQIHKPHPCSLPPHSSPPGMVTSPRPLTLQQLTPSPT